MKIELTEQEAQVLLSLMDAAVRAQGLQAAANAVHLANKIQEAAQEKETED